MTVSFLLDLPSEGESNKKNYLEHVAKQGKISEIVSEDTVLEELGTTKHSSFPEEVNQTADKSPLIQNSLPLSECDSLFNIKSSTHVNDCELYHINDSSCSVAEEFVPNQGVTHSMYDECHMADYLHDNITPIQKQERKGRLKDYCFYCKTFVLNFARHLFRHHFNETDVQNILSTQKKSLKRLQLIAALRKKGNFLVNSKTVSKPMRTGKSVEYVPCTNCLGFYSKRQLWKHKQKCTDSKKGNKNVQSGAQSLLVRHLAVDERLKDTVFPQMRPDKISLVAKKDYLICAFGSQYLKTHTEKYFINVVLIKMRKLAKLLIEIRKIAPSIKNLFAALRPNYYDIIVQATKVLGKYDKEKHRYEAPTLAVNMSSILKQCCKIAIRIALKKEGSYRDEDADKIKADLKTLIEHIELNWRYDIYFQAATDLNKTYSSNTITIVPLANDLKIFKEYLNKKSLDAAVKIKEGSQNTETYTQLLETVYCRVSLLNRQRHADIQRIILYDYLDSENCATDKSEEFDGVFTPLEWILVKKSKRVVFRDEHKRGLHVLFTQEVQDDLKLLLSIRNIVFASAANQYLFGKPGYGHTINGYKVLKKHARLCGAMNTEAISSINLRKYLATLSQVFIMSDNDIEQLATYMDHTSGVQSYGLPDDVYQIAKISKLLILMEEGKADTYKGKSLEEVDLDMDENLHVEVLEDNKNLEFDCKPILTANSDCSQDICNSTYLFQAGSSSLQNGDLRVNDEQVPKFSTIDNTLNRKKRILVPWTRAQKDAVTNYFKLHIKNHKPPKKHECNELKEQHGDLLHNKDWQKIKVLVQNIYSKSKN